MKLKEFLKKKDIELSWKRYFIDALGAMAQGLFCSLLIGTILDTVGDLTGWGLLNEIGDFAKTISGAAMAVAIGYALKAPNLVLFSLVLVGYAANFHGGAGGPLAVLIIAIIAAECGKLVSKETKIDVLVTPLVTIMAGVPLSALISPWIGKGASAFGTLVMRATELQPLLMGILVSVLVGIALTLPISSAAICAALGLTGLAGGAAVAGCCAQMVGFAVMSFRENRWGGLVSQGLGTSMLQMGNIVRNPRIWIPPTVASAITGPLATCLFKLEMNGPAVSSGMGTCGLVGQIGVYTGWVESGHAITAWDWIGLVLICFVLPAIIRTGAGRGKGFSKPRIASMLFFEKQRQRSTEGSYAGRIVGRRNADERRDYHLILYTRDGADAPGGRGHLPRGGMEAP
ncbi:MAG: PTS sugar transporter subunit IIC, partial [Clostridia bacterium]|nr:PTS sugar transporter subunit IIC [Clostridia bacterium]